MTALRELLAAREGHFRFESGHHGHLRLELDGLFLDPGALEPLVAVLAAGIGRHRPDLVVGPFTGGALLAFGVAGRLGAGFAATQRRGHDPERLYSASYPLPDAVRPHLAGRRVAVVDDVVNAGSAVRATLAAVRDAGGEPVAVGALLFLGEAASRHADLAALPRESCESWPHELWTPESCPRCAAGEPLEEAG
jgi:orotate phosphoribosyltransferase